MTGVPPLVLIPQHFGALVFDRRTSRYLPFDHESAELLRALAERPIEAVLAGLSPEERQTAARFCEHFEARGFFTLEGTLAGTVLQPEIIPADHLVGPLAVHVEIIGACNLACTHCFAGVLPRNQNPLTLGELDALFAELASLGSFRLGLTGGEPLLRRDLFGILDAALEHGLHPCLTTNGLLITEEIARELGKRPFAWLNVSLEGPDAASNDAVRGPGTFAAVREKLRLLARHARFTLAFTVLRTNAHLARQCAELAWEVGAHTAVFRPLYPTGIALHHPELMPDFAQYAGALRDLENLDLPGADPRGLDVFGPEGRAETEASIHTSHSCGAGNQVCSVSVQGEVSPCSFLGPGFGGGNLREQRFADIWRDSPVFRQIRRPAPPGGFSGGCRARAQALAGSADAADPWFEDYRRGQGLMPHPGANVELARRPLPILFSQCHVEQG